MQAQGSFIGHIGGDDFVFIMDLSLVEDTAKEILDAFDRIIPTLYEAEDRERGCIEIKDRPALQAINKNPLPTLVKLLKSLPQ